MAKKAYSSAACPHTEERKEMTLSPENASGPYAGIHAPHTAPSRYHAASTAPLRKTHHRLMKHSQSGGGDG
ncbi:hypothetical protein KZO69_09910 [Prevotella denticola]|nr:hypothetical protein [Prevotella denticola]MBW4752860.1 hypothetical protein [Prevotella denticola]